MEEHNKRLIPYGEAKTTCEPQIQVKILDDQTEMEDDLTEVFSVGWKAGDRVEPTASTRLIYSS